MIKVVLYCIVYFFPMTVESEKYDANLVRLIVDRSNTKYAHKQSTNGEKRQSTESLNRASCKLQWCSNGGKLNGHPNSYDETNYPWSNIYKLTNKH